MTLLKNFGILISKFLYSSSSRGHQHYKFHLYPLSYCFCQNYIIFVSHMQLKKPPNSLQLLSQLLLVEVFLTEKNQCMLKFQTMRGKKKIYVLVKITKNITKSAMSIWSYQTFILLYIVTLKVKCMYVCMYVWVTENVKDKFIQILILRGS